MLSRSSEIGMIRKLEQVKGLTSDHLPLMPRRRVICKTTLSPLETMFKLLTGAAADKPVSGTPPCMGRHHALPQSQPRGILTAKLSIALQGIRVGWVSGQHPGTPRKHKIHTDSSGARIRRALRSRLPHTHTHTCLPHIRLSANTE